MLLKMKWFAILFLAVTLSTCHVKGTLMAMTGMLGNAAARSYNGISNRAGGGSGNYGSTNYNSYASQQSIGKMIGDKIDSLLALKAMLFGPLMNMASVMSNKFSAMSYSNAGGGMNYGGSGSMNYGGSGGMNYGGGGNMNYGGSGNMNYGGGGNTNYGGGGNMNVGGGENMNYGGGGNMNVGGGGNMNYGGGGNMNYGGDGGGNYRQTSGGSSGSYSTNSLKYSSVNSKQSPGSHSDDGYVDDNGDRYVETESADMLTKDDSDHDPHHIDEKNDKFDEHTDKKKTDNVREYSRLASASSKVRLVEFEHKKEVTTELPEKLKSFVSPTPL